jgi:hypothetical protein
VKAALAKRAWAPVLAAAACALLVVFGWRCPVRRVTGHPCPTCGITRAVRLALAGDFGAATRMHPLVWVLVPFVAAWIGIEVGGYVRSGAWGASGRIPHGGKALVGVAALTFAVWIARFYGAFGGPTPG